MREIPTMKRESDRMWVVARYMESLVANSNVVKAIVGRGMINETRYCGKKSIILSTTPFLTFPLTNFLFWIIKYPKINKWIQFYPQLNYEKGSTKIRKSKGSLQGARWYCKGQHRHS